MLQLFRLISIRDVLLHYGNVGILQGAVGLLLELSKAAYLTSMWLRMMCFMAALVAPLVKA